jgi:hypothetical protein
MLKQRQALWSRTSVRLVGVATIGVGLAVLGSYAIERWFLEINQFGVEYGTSTSDTFLKFEVSGVDRPKIIEASQSKLSPDEEVFGIVVGGKARAYRLDAFRDKARHVVNDLIGDLPISVTYCDLGDCVRGYAGAPGEGRLRLSTAGLMEGRQMILEYEGKRYHQDSGKPFRSGAAESILPLERLDLIRTTWERWKRDYPETEVYEGVIEPAPSDR